MKEQNKNRTKDDIKTASGVVGGCIFPNHRLAPPAFWDRIHPAEIIVPLDVVCMFIWSQSCVA